jgi:exopolyphosphatase/guanosine-5'-triphosphate,3'-diphosphate pyrophosphatase
LVVDIGGRSTEIILGKGFKPKIMESYRVGSVKWSMKYFADGKFSASSFDWAEVAAKAVLDEALSLYPRNSWDIAYGSSGTIGAVADVLQAAGWPEETISREGLNWLKEKLIKSGDADSLRLEGVKEDRKPVIGGGLAVLCALFDLMQIDTMHAAQGALRHGVLYDLLQREENTDLRSTMVAALGNRFAVDTLQAQRVQKTADTLFKGVFDKSTCDATRALRLEKKLGWAAHLLEIGTRISHSDFHKHGAYILDNADLPGFSMSELHRLSQLILGHRGKLKKLEVELKNPEFMIQLMSLRIAAILCHARRDPDLKGFNLKIADDNKTGFILECKKSWIQQWPQSAHLLREECIAWQKTTWQLELVEINGKTV